MKMVMAILSWLVALSCITGAALEVKAKVQRKAQAAAPENARSPTLRAEKLGLSDYQAIAKSTAVYGSVELVLSEQGISIEAASLSDYAAWRLTLDRVLLEASGISWEVEYLCSGRCPAELAHKALLKGVRKMIEL